MKPCASRILSVVKNEGHPQVISTSRHISHGAIDLQDVKWDAEGRVLSGVSKVVGGEAYSLIVTGGPGNMPPAQYSNHTSTAEVEGLEGGLYRLTYHPEEDGALSWSVAYVPGPERGE